jgi:glycosyltransferase involved in cell wall biosynthesis
MSAKPMPNICIDCRYINGRPSGIGEMVAALAARLPRIAPDWRFTFLTSRAVPRLHRDAENVMHVPVAASANGPATMWFLPRLIDLAEIDLFHAPANILPAGLAMPTVTTIHDLMWLQHPEWCSPGLLHPVRRAFFASGISRALRRSSGIAAVSSATAATIRAHCPDAASRTHVTLSGVSSDFIPVPRDDAVLAACGLDPRRRYVLVVGQYAPYKNHKGAITAFASACRSLEDVDLVLVQRRGRDAAELLSLARKVGVADRVRLIGPVGRAELIQLYAAAALLLHPSLCEGFGNPVIEAMACGCPVVTSNISAMPEVAGGAALLADPRDEEGLARQIAAIIGDDRMAQDLRRRGLVRAGEMRWEHFAEANLALYKRVLAKGRD